MNTLSLNDIATKIVNRIVSIQIHEHATIITADANSITDVNYHSYYKVDSAIVDDGALCLVAREIPMQHFYSEYTHWVDAPGWKNGRESAWFPPNWDSNNVHELNKLVYIESRPYFKHVTVKRLFRKPVQLKRLCFGWFPYKEQYWNPVSTLVLKQNIIFRERT